MPTPITTHITILANPPRKVYAMEYHSDRSNQNDVIRFIENFAHAKADPYKAGGAYELVHAKQIDHTDLWIRPGSTVYIYTNERRNIASMGSDRFPHYFKPFTAEDSTVYSRIDKPFGPRVRAYHFLRDEKDNLQGLIDFLSPHCTVATGSVFIDGNVYLYTSPDKLHVFGQNNARSYGVKLTVKKDTWITITDPPTSNDKPVLQLFSDETFRNTFISTTTLNATPTPKDPTVITTTTNNFVSPTPTTVTEEADYDTNISAVYDALAILRKDPREQDFEFAAKEIMALLAHAYDEGYDFGLEVGQTNPYKNWNK